ncbi:hypothetical protein BDC45DRAFT_495588 [Circinella umbellata]|nr:hypothetical protein BDC45DRAFT_495588 [Circinella umbellata]
MNDDYIKHFFLSLICILIKQPSLMKVILSGKWIDNKKLTTRVTSNIVTYYSFSEYP